MPQLPFEVYKPSLPNPPPPPPGQLWRSNYLYLLSLKYLPFLETAATIHCPKVHSALLLNLDGIIARIKDI
jgi:hypothetical protein